MHLYFIRHAKAAIGDGKTPDAARPLTPRGREKFHHAAKALRRLAPRIELILFSPLLRARQTAEILAQVLESGGRNAVQLEQADFLAPPGRLDALLSRLNDLQDTAGAVAIVGHEPMLSTWIGRMCFNQPGRCEMKKGGAAIVELSNGGQGQLCCLLPPALLRRLADR